MGVIVRLLDAAAGHLKKPAEKLGRKVIAKGGGSSTEILDGYILRALGNENNAVVTVIGMDAFMASFGYRIFAVDGVTGFLQENRQSSSILRSFFNGDVDYALPTGGTIYDGTKLGYEGVAIGVAPTFYENAYTRRCITEWGVTTGAHMRVASTLHIRRSTAGSKWLDAGPSAPQYLPHGNEVSKGKAMFITLDISGAFPAIDNEVACVSPQIAELREVFVGVVQVGHRDTPPGESIRFVPRTFAFGCVVDYETATPQIVWTTDLPSPAGFTDDAKWPFDGAAGGLTGDQTPYVVAAAESQVLAVVGRHTVEELAAPELCVTSLDPTTGTKTEAVFPLGNRRVAHLWGVSVDGAPYVVVPTTVGRPDPGAAYPGGLSFDETYAADLGASLVTPDLQLVPLELPGFFLQPGSMDPRFGDVTTTPEGPSRRRYAVEYAETPMYGAARGCEYAPGYLAVVLIPIAEFSAVYLSRYLGVVDLASGQLVHVGSAPLCPPGTLWTPVNLSCVETGRVDEDTGEIVKPPILLVSSYGIDSDLVPHTFNWDAVGLWTTTDGGNTMKPAYPVGLPPSVKQRLPIINATYLGTPLLPAAIGRSRRQWTG